MHLRPVLCAIIVKVVTLLLTSFLEYVHGEDWGKGLYDTLIVGADNGKLGIFEQMVEPFLSNTTDPERLEGLRCAIRSARLNAHEIFFMV